MSQASKLSFITSATGSLVVSANVYVAGSINSAVIGSSNNISTSTIVGSNVNALSFGAITIGPGGSLFVPVGSQYKITTY